MTTDGVDGRLGTRTKMFIAVVIQVKGLSSPVKVRNMSEHGALIDSPLRSGSVTASSFIEETCLRRVSSFGRASVAAKCSSSARSWCARGWPRRRILDRRWSTI